MRWAFDIADLNGVARALLSPRQVVVTRALNAPSTIQLTADAAAGAELSTTARVIRCYRSPAGGGERVLRAVGQVSGINAAVATDALERLTITASDGMGVLASRQVQATVTYTQQTPRFIVNDLVAVQNARRATGTRVAAGTAGPLRDRTYEQGKVVSEAIQQLAEVDDGFYYRVDPIDEGGTFWEIVLLHPSPGGDAVATFEWGAGTVGNLSGVSADITTPVNNVTAFGAGDGAEQLRAMRSDPTSITSLGLFDASVTHSDVSVQETLDQHALDALRHHEPRVFRVQVAGTVSTTAPWDDFDVGDTVKLNLRGRSAALQHTGRVLVTSFTVTVDHDGTERLTALDFGEL